ncbi:hypothetical protein Poly59_13810 [Rubripirellula reticaptiva]|uniref:Uncharacterized protein n=1 Tax=Rubripirellula reticaptiva TaxID=2528013 RepID=A0A5C6F4V3_9BACT|nr:hypothetical protein Poly59_13810 [Rubripirellula reticaptiva]
MIQTGMKEPPPCDLRPAACVLPCLRFPDTPNVEDTRQRRKPPCHSESKVFCRKFAIKSLLTSRRDPHWLEPTGRLGSVANGRLFRTLQ